MHDRNETSRDDGAALADLRERALRELAKHTDRRDPTALQLAPRADGATIHATYADGSHLSRDGGDAEFARTVHTLANTAWHRLGPVANAELSLEPGANGRPTRVLLRTRNPLARDGHDLQVCTWDKLRAGRAPDDRRRQQRMAADAT